MKKLLGTFVILILLLSATLLSCDRSTEVTTQEIMDNVSSSMDGLSSVEIDAETNIQIYVATTKLNFVGSAQFVYQTTDESDLYYYNKTDMTIQGAGIEETTSAIEAFNDGNYFLSYSYGGKQKRLYSENTAEEFINYYEGKSDEKSIFDGYKKASHVKSTTGTYIITLTEYDSEVVDFINEGLGFPMENGGGRVTDCTATLTVDSDYVISKLVVDYIFSNTEFSGSQTMYFYNYNTAEKITDTIDPDDYTKVPDAISVSLYSDLVSKRENSKSGAFAFSLTQKVTLAGSSTVHNEEDTVFYGVDDSGYYFDVDADLNGEDYEITYKNGIYKINGKPDNSTDRNDVTSKAFINGLIDPFEFLPNDVKEITLSDTDEGRVYGFKLESSYGATVDKLKAIFQSAGATYQSAEIYLEFTVKDYEILSIKYTIDSTGYVRYNNSTYYMSLEMETFTDFNPDTAPVL